VRRHLLGAAVDLQMLHEIEEPRPRPFVMGNLGARARDVNDPLRRRGSCGPVMLGWPRAHSGFDGGAL